MPWMRFDNNKVNEISRSTLVKLVRVVDCDARNMNKRLVPIDVVILYYLFLVLLILRCVDSPSSVRQAWHSPNARARLHKFLSRTRVRQKITPHACRWSPFIGTKVDSARHLRPATLLPAEIGPGYAIFYRVISVTAHVQFFEVGSSQRCEHKCQRREEYKPSRSRAVVESWVRIAIRLVCYHILLNSSTTPEWPERMKTRRWKPVGPPYPVRTCNRTKTETNERWMTYGNSADGDSDDVDEQRRWFRPTVMFDGLTHAPWAMPGRHWPIATISSCVRPANNNKIHWNAYRDKGGGDKVSNRADKCDSMNINVWNKTKKSCITR